MVISNSRSPSNSPAPPASQWKILAGLRFVLATLVALFHLSCFMSVSAPIAAGRTIAAMAAVLGFLVLSGYSIAASLGREKEHFYARRF